MIYDMRCDVCGKFMKVEPGASWVNVPSCDIPGGDGDERERCKKCTAQFGPAEPWKVYIGCHGVYA